MELGTHEGDHRSSTAATATQDMKDKASELTRTVRQRAMQTIDEQKAQAAELLEKVARTAESDRLGSFAAEYARRGARFLRDRSADEILSSARSQLRSRPGLLLSACFVGGLAVARMLRAGRDDGKSWRDEWRDPAARDDRNREFWRESPGWQGQSTWERGQP